MVLRADRLTRRESCEHLLLPPRARLRPLDQFAVQTHAAAPSERRRVRDGARRLRSDSKVVVSSNPHSERE